jgi:hypothetical protein
MESSVEFADALRQFFTSFVIQPVQALDTGQVRPQAVLTFPVAHESSSEELVLNLFRPPVHIGWIPEILRLRGGKPKPSYKQIAEKLGVHEMTVKRAMKYVKLMEQRGAAEPYVALTEKPQTASRWRQAS